MLHLYLMDSFLDKNTVCGRTQYQTKNTEVPFLSGLELCNEL